MSSSNTTTTSPKHLPPHLQLYSVRTRSRVVDIYNKLASLIAHSNGHDKGSAKQLLYPSLPQFIEVFVKALQQPNGLSCDNGLRIEIVKVAYPRPQLWNP